METLLQELSLTHAAWVRLNNIHNNTYRGGGKKTQAFLLSLTEQILGHCLCCALQIMSHIVDPCSISAYPPTEP